MKKFDIKWLLILVLVIVLAFGLVACGSKGGNETPEEEEEQTVVDPNKSDAAEFFGTLWEASKSLGAEQVNPQQDKVHIGMAMDISLTSDNVAELDVGVKLGLVADLKAMNTTDNLGDTALMLQAFDKATGDNWITLWYFLKDKDNLYFKVQNQNFKVSFDAYWNAEFSTLLDGLLGQDMSFLKGSEKSLLALINGIAASGGSEWTLDTLVLGNKTKGGNFGGLLAAFGLDLGELLSSLPDGLLGKGTDTSSLGSILKAMGGVVVESKECKKIANADGSTTYKAGKLSTTATTLLNGFTDNLFKSVNSFSLQYNVKNGAIDDLVIAIAGKKDLANAEIKIAITELTIKKVTAESTTVLGKENSYSSYAKIQWEGYMDASAWGIELDPDLNPNTADIKIGKVKINLDATIDLVGAGDANKTAAKLTITNDITATNDDDAEEVLTATYKQNVLTLKTDLSTPNNKAIAVEALSPLCDLIEKASVGEDAIVAYKIFGDMAKEVRKEMFNNVAKPTVANVNADFKSISITGVDIKVLAKGAFYAIFSGFATGSDKEKPAAATELTTFAGVEYTTGTGENAKTYKDTYVLDGRHYQDGQYAWSLDIKQTAAVVLKAIKYAGTASQKDKDYSIELTSIAATLKSIFKKATIESIEKTKADVAAPANVDEMMALFMCTNDGILLDLTTHGFLPLYKDGITTTYITDTYTPEKAAKDGYYAISGKMISKADALLIWNFLTKKSTTLKLSFESNNADTYVPDKDKATATEYVDESAISWFVKFIDGTTLINGKTVANVIEYVTGTDSAIKISLNRKDGSMSCDIKLAGSSTTGYIKYTISGTNDALDVTAIDYSATADGNKVVVNLDDKFYALFKAAFGMGPTTTLANGHGINTDFYYVASDVDYDTDAKAYDSIAYTKGAIILVDATHCYVLDNDGVYSALSTYAIADGVLTVNGTDGYTIYGNSYKVVKAIPQP